MAHDHGSGGHAHHHGAAAMRAGARHQRPLAIAFALTLGFLVVQVVTGFATNPSPCSPTPDTWPPMSSASAWRLL